MYIYINDTIHKDIHDTKYANEGMDGLLTYFGPLGKVNILVGANNSGKSRFMRGLLKTNSIIKTDYPDINIYIGAIMDNIQELIDRLGRNFIVQFEIPGSNKNPQHWTPINGAHRALLKEQRNFDFNENYFKSKHSEFQSFLDKPSISSFVTGITKMSNELEVIIGILDKSKRELLNRSHQSGAISTITMGNTSVLPTIERLFNQCQYVLNANVEEFEMPQKVYVPTLRTTHSLFSTGINEGGIDKIARDIFANSVYHNYKFNRIEKDNLNRISFATGLNFYNDIKSVRNNIKAKREAFEAFEKFVSNGFFGDKTVDIVAKHVNFSEEEHISIYINDVDRDVHDLGDGIQSILMLMYPLYTSPEGSWIFIEEPEINLHPGFQRIFMEQLLNDKYLADRKLRVFITTHSNHLLDLSLELGGDVSIFSFRKEGENHILKNVKNRDTDVLHQLGVRNSSVFMANCSIWVEGVTDRIYIKAFLEAYSEKFVERKPFKEDIQFAFYEYAGSNVAHYIFTDPADLEEDLLSKEKIKAQFLSNKIYLVADKDEGKDEKHSELLKKQNSNFQYSFLDCREIENLLSPQQLIRFVPLLSAKIDALEAANLKLKYEDYQEKYLGKYISSKFKPVSGKSFPKLKDDSGSGTLTSRYKLFLAEKAAENMKWDEMSEPAKKLTESIYQFIRRCNS